MVGQVKISQFFVPNKTTSKRSVCNESKDSFDKNGKNEDSINVRTKTPPRKKAKLEENFSDKQLDRIETNRLSALIKRASKITPALHTTIGISWFQALQAEFSKPYFHKLSGFLVEERKKFTIYPPEDKVYSWTQMCELQEIKVVILGQDPYHGPNQAHGLCFSVQEGITPPPSLVNMYNELERDIPDFKIPSHGNLSGWAKQGVLLLNACLTVRAHQPNSHKDQGWERLTDAVISWINTNLDGVVFLLWGSYAQKKASSITKSRHHVLQCPHPSPLSAHRGFNGCQHFSKANELLKKQGKKPIRWADLKLDNKYQDFCENIGILDELKVRSLEKSTCCTVGLQFRSDRSWFLYDFLHRCIDYLDELIERSCDIIATVQLGADKRLLKEVNLPLICIDLGLNRDNMSCMLTLTEYSTS